MSDPEFPPTQPASIRPPCSRLQSSREIQLRPSLPYRTSLLSPSILYSTSSPSTPLTPPPEYRRALDRSNAFDTEILPSPRDEKDAKLDHHILKNQHESPDDHQDLYHSDSDIGTQSIRDEYYQSNHQPDDSDHHSESDIDGQDLDDYDWDNDEDLEGDVRFADLHDDEDRDRNNHRRKTLARRFSPYSIVKFIVTSFIGNIFLSALLLVPILVPRFDGYYKSGNDPDEVRSRYIYDNVAAWMCWASFNLVNSWGIHFLVEFVPRLVVLLVGVFWGGINENIKGRIESFQAAKAWVKVILFSAMYWGSWEVMFGRIYGLYSLSENGQYRAPYTSAVHRVVQLLFFLMLILSLEKLLLMHISMNFHQVAYSDRIQRVTKVFAVIDTLQNYRPKQKSCPSPLSNLQRKTHDLADQDRSPHNSPKNNKPWSLKQKPSQGESVESKMESELDNYNSRTKPKLSRRNSQGTFTSFTQRGLSAAKIARAVMKDPISVVGKKSGLKLDINNPSEARKLARKIYFGMKADPNRKYLIPSDFYPAFPTHEMAKDAFSIFDSDGNGDISGTEVKNEIFRAYKERRALANSLQDVGHAIRRLDGIMMILAGIIFIFMALALLRVNSSKAFSSVYTVAIAAAFIFKESAGKVFDAIVMLFCTHPYDTGDRVIMDNDGVEEVLVVKKMGLLVTIFTRWDGTEWFAPNSLIGEKFIINLRRSFNQKEAATVQFGWDTPLEKLHQLEEKMKLWLQSEERGRFEPGTSCGIQSLVNQQYIEVTLGMTHRQNWQDWYGRLNRRTAFHAALTQYSRELGITFYNSEQPIELMNVQELKKQLLRPDDEDDQLHCLDEPDELDGEGLGANKSERLFHGPSKSNSSRKPYGAPPLRFSKGKSGLKTNDNQEADRLSILTTATSGSGGGSGGGDGELDRRPEALGFSAPPESGTGMPKRKWN